jgi:hypothetical protein
MKDRKIQHIPIFTEQDDAEAHLIKRLAFKKYALGI